MAGLHGNTSGVGRDIVDYLAAVAVHFNLTITVTSGYRNPSDQADAMLRYWVKLKRGKVYSKKSLPEVERQTLDDHYVTCKENPKASLADRQKAKASFLKVAAAQLGGKSKHCSGRAVDVTQASVTPAAYRAIVEQLQEVQEKRRDIYHFECVAKIPQVTDDDRKRWDKLSTAPLAMSTTAVGTFIAAGLPCSCTT
jgi:hypothetical protein